MSDERVTMSDIARRLEITVPAVSNWRRRHPSFPSAESINGQDTFLVEDVASWLDDRKISKKDLRPNELPGTTYGTRFRNSMTTGHSSTVAVQETTWRELNRLRGAEDVAEFADLVLGRLYLAISEDADWRDTAGIADSDYLRLGNVSDQGRLVKIVRSIERVRQSGLGPDVFEYLFDQFMAAEGRRGAEMHTPSTVARLVVALLAPARGTRSSTRVVALAPSC